FVPRGSVCLMILIVPQFESVNLPGPTRSSIAAVPESPELRLTASTCPKFVQVPGVNTPALVRSIVASPNSLFCSVSVEGASESEVWPGSTYCVPAVLVVLWSDSPGPQPVGLRFVLQMWLWPSSTFASAWVAFSDVNGPQQGDEPTSQGAPGTLVQTPRWIVGGAAPPVKS